MSGASILGTPTIAVGSATADATARRTFTRDERLIVRAALRDGSSTVVKAHLLSRLGQRLTEVPVSVAAEMCELTLLLGNLGAGDYVIELSAQRGDAVAQRYIAFRVLR